MFCRSPIDRASQSIRVTARVSVARKNLKQRRQLRAAVGAGRVHFRFDWHSHRDVRHLLSRLGRAIVQSHLNGGNWNLYRGADKAGRRRGASRCGRPCLARRRNDRSHTRRRHKSASGVAKELNRHSTIGQQPRCGCTIGSRCSLGRNDGAGASQRSRTRPLKLYRIAGRDSHRHRRYDPRMCNASVCPCAWTQQ
jgi:hypothetical protein